MNSSDINETYHTDVKPAKRQAVCSLKNAINANIDGKLFCLAYIGQMKHKDALQSCQRLNATLPLPHNRKEHYQFIESLNRLGIHRKMADFSTKIIIDVRRSSQKGNVSLYSASDLSYRFMLRSPKDIFKGRGKESLSYVNWALGQPNNFGNDQNFVSISYPNFKWGDWSGDTIGEVICQQEIKGKTNDLYFSV